MCMSKRKNTISEKPGFLWGFSAALLFAILNLFALYLDIHFLSYISVIPALFIVFWFIARITG